MKRCPDCNKDGYDDSEIFCPICCCRLERSQPNYSSNQTNYNNSNGRDKKDTALGCFVMLLILGVLIFLIVIGVRSCKNSNQSSTAVESGYSSPTKGSEPYKEIEYKIGDRGEAGVVFYDKGYYSDGWRYLECAKDAIENQPWDSNCTNMYFDLSQNIGDGDFNTYKIIHNLGTKTAAYAAHNYDGGGKHDWYLGNIKEMQTLFNNLVDEKKNRKKVDSYTDVLKLYTTLGDAISSKDTLTYITSNQKDEEYCYIVFFATALGYNGGETSLIKKDWKRFVNGYDIDHCAMIRPIRKF